MGAVVQCSVEVAVIAVGSGYVEYESTVHKPAEFAKARAYPYGKGHRIEVPSGATVPDDLLVPISGKKQLPKFRCAINEALRSTIGTVVPLTVPTRVAPSVPKPPKVPKVVKTTKPKRIAPPMLVGNKACLDCGADKPVAEYYMRATGRPHAICRACYRARYVQKDRSPPPTKQVHGVSPANYGGGE